MAVIKRVRLSEIAELVTKGTTPTTLGYEFQDTGVNFLKIECFSEKGDYIQNKATHISEECHEKLKRSQLKEGDILFSIAGVIGRVAIVTRNMLPANINQALAIIRIKKDDIYLPYVKLILTSPLIKKQFERKKQGVAQLNISLKDINDLEIPLPEIGKQIEYANSFKKVEKLIYTRQYQLQKLDELVKARFVEMFGDDKYSKMPLINLITEGAGLSYGIVQPGDSGTGDMGVLRPVDMVNGEISTHSIKYIDRSIGASFKKTELVGDELLITVRGTTGVTALTDSRFKNMNVTRGIAVIRYDRRKINPIYLNAFLNTDESQQYIQEHTRGATLQQINLSDLRVHMIPVPPIELQEKLADFIQQVDKSKVAVQKSLDEAQLLFDSLMQHYFG